MKSHCLHEHEGPCKQDICQHRECDRYVSPGKEKLFLAKKEIEEVFKKYSGVEIDVDIYGTGRIVLRYFNPGSTRYSDEIELED